MAYERFCISSYLTSVVLSDHYSLPTERYSLHQFKSLRERIAARQADSRSIVSAIEASLLRSSKSYDNPSMPSAGHKK